MFGFLPHNLFTNHVNQNTTGLSPRLWSRVSGTVMSSDGQKRLVLAGDDFMSVHPDDAAAPTYVLSDENYDVQSGDSDYTILGSTTDSGGAIVITTGATVEDEVYVSSGAVSTVFGSISDTNNYLTAIECRFKVDAITDNALSMFIGLAEEGWGAADDIANGGALATNDYIGFHIEEDDGDSIDAVYRKSGAAHTQSMNPIQVPVADTYYKLGFIFDPEAPADKRITWYADNEEQTTYVTETVIEAASVFPTDQMLKFVAGIKTADGTVSALTIDWWAYAQLIP